jgi:hypothetical protein
MPTLNMRNLASQSELQCSHGGLVKSISQLAKLEEL